MNFNKDSKGRTLYCVAADLILINENKVLLQRRANTGWNDGKWNLVGGHVENDETLKQCIVREAKEELGITIKEKDVQLVHCIQYKSNRLTIQFYLKCTKWKGQPAIQPEEVNGKQVFKADKIEWFAINKLPADLISTARHAILASSKEKAFSIMGFDNSDTKL